MSDEKAPKFPLYSTMHMEINPNNGTCFTVELIDGCTKRLQIPTDFAKQWKGKSREYCRFKCTNHEKLWRVHIIKNKGSYFFSYGWRKFAKIHKLEEGNLLRFFLVHPRIFEVHIYKEGPCPASPKPSNHNGGSAFGDLVKTKKQPNVKAPRNMGAVKKETESREEEAGEDPYFEVHLKSYQNSRLIPPVAFIKETGIADKENLLMLNSEGRKWHIDVVVKEVGRCRRVELRTGWGTFRKDNKLADGDLCHFQYVKSSGNVIRCKKIQE